MESNAAPPSLLTHIALSVRDLDATLAFYERFTTLVNIHERIDPELGLRSVCDGESRWCLLLGPMYRNEVVGYICIVTDPDGNNIEFSVEQVLG